MASISKINVLVLFAGLLVAGQRVMKAEEVAQEINQKVSVFEKEVKESLSKTFQKVLAEAEANDPLNNVYTWNKVAYYATTFPVKYILSLVALSLFKVDTSHTLLISFLALDSFLISPLVQAAIWSNTYRERFYSRILNEVLEKWNTLKKLVPEDSKIFEKLDKLYSDYKNDTRSLKKFMYRTTEQEAQEIVEQLAQVVTV